MTSRERVEAALAFEPVDKAPLEYHPCGRGLYESTGKRLAAAESPSRRF